MIVGRLLYACEQEDAKPDHERLHQICIFIKAARSMDALTATGPLLQARAVVKSRVEELSDSLIGEDPWTSLGAQYQEHVLHQRCVAGAIPLRSVSHGLMACRHRPA